LSYVTRTVSLHMARDCMSCSYRLWMEPVNT
jgi:hypothetical protein